MGWVNEQIEERKQHDAFAFQESLFRVSDAVLGTSVANNFAEEYVRSENAIYEVLKYYRIKSKKIPEKITDFESQLNYLLQPHGIMRRQVVLEKGWYNNAIGAMLARTKTGDVVALIPSRMEYYEYLDAKTGKRTRVTKKTAELFESDAICFYKPLPEKKLSIKDLLIYMADVLSTFDYIVVFVATMLSTVVGLCLPLFNKLLISNVVESKNINMLFTIALCMFNVTVSQLFLVSIRKLLIGRVGTKLQVYIRAATMIRIISLPSSFFKTYNSGNLGMRMEQVNVLCNQLVTIVFDTLLTGVFSLMYIMQIFTINSSLAYIAAIIILATFANTLISTYIQTKLTQQQLEVLAEERGISYASITGIQKIKLSGAEKRFFARWANVFAKRAKLLYDPPVYMKFSGVINTAITAIGTIVIYFVALQNHINVSEYYAFIAAYTVVSQAFLEIANAAKISAQVKPVLEMIKPVLQTETEVNEGREILKELHGAIEINNLSFRYTEDMPLVLDDLSLKISSGQYVAIVGSTGCGKSTLMRLLLGFETPQKGSIYYDGKDLSTIDLKSLRRLVGSVMQLGGLFMGDIFSNITISAPWLTEDAAWEAAEIAGLSDYIKSLPMGMHTMIGEGSGGISGGQKQRLMIARAVAPKPKILMFDEATSALDNITQKQIATSLDSMKCTRIVIAHRLSTIKNCDRIIVLEKGKIIEDGTYDELISQNGFFAKLVERQRLDK